MPNLSKILKNYNKNAISIGVLGGHSALDVCHGAKKFGFKTVAVCQKGRSQTYTKYFKSRERNGLDVGCIDHVINVDKFSDIVKPEIQEELQALNTIFIHNRYFWVYCNFAEIENNFQVPIHGSRIMVKLEERDVERNQYFLLREAGIRTPHIFKDPKSIDRLVLVKVNEAIRTYERAFFLANNYADYVKKSSELLKSGKITEQALNDAIIEEYIIGAHVNFNYFYSVLNKELELMGTDTRRQTNLDGILRLPAPEQIEVLKYLKPTMVETGHYTVTTKESILEKIFDIGEKFVKITQNEYDPGIIGAFALQGAVASENGKEELVIFDVSMRIPGSPGTKFTPHTSYLYGESISYGERIAIEIQQAIDENRLNEIVT
ncbi:5-formaminoimidazole-4-carboxamide-1-(beta)-D-ribofuranosyl 5'-monophosphate synthetase [Candidatus Peregrinibacteria bacterium RIFOXYA12_FULL_33_12]|nr:MAG: 5-formaminoimidazole-4-carboxamide-1-(beta)-D-ribofuranosyl 5'-monophosphate synthetase [Candidatus Peregrinibacteria bacterium RIFOXYA2_FULL_33_21]OGJ46530.1 MAG: 5-formaminoimidazole-4-carboxamide-1-(beta)-D-ribofuranosyl 5'-monophosphate synthetase [Candidatus Peregrinibacteria bacterium RIFOXYA12_FULL_33_12]OGJ50568.1 MAG: 5-formaminoimidazole-4-carboxamide-1-(beta)-D-ribofuranosyl 5'-monophosphate synthetase [Candidatus Peregrinibacteria bacterium RIFOXYB2_FULL_33_20]